MNEYFHTLTKAVFTCGRVSILLALSLISDFDFTSELYAYTRLLS